MYVRGPSGQIVYELKLPPIPSSGRGRTVHTKAHLSFPDIRKLGLQFRGWRPEPPYMQTIAPRDPNLAGKLGIKPNAKVLVMAGYFGNWARSLARFCEVRYTDIGRQMTDFVKKHPGKFARLQADLPRHLCAGQRFMTGVFCLNQFQYMECLWY